MTCEMKELGVVKIASPCKVKWSKLKGDERVRFCTLCGLNVYNLSKMTSDDARALLTQREPGRLCVRFYVRRDGTVLTEDCPRGRLTKSHWATARTVGGALGLVVLALLSLVTLFGDNLRHFLFYDNMGALAGEEPAPAPVAFDAQHPPPGDAPEWLKQQARTVFRR